MQLHSLTKGTLQTSGLPGPSAFEAGDILLQDGPRRQHPQTSVSTLAAAGEPSVTLTPVLRPWTCGRVPGPAPQVGQAAPARTPGLRPTGALRGGVGGEQGLGQEGFHSQPRNILPSLRRTPSLTRCRDAHTHTPRSHTSLLRPASHISHLHTPPHSHAYPPPPRQSHILSNACTHHACQLPSRAHTFTPAPHARTGTPTPWGLRGPGPSHCRHPSRLPPQNRSHSLTHGV